MRRNRKIHETDGDFSSADEILKYRDNCVRWYQSDWGSTYEDASLCPFAHNKLLATNAFTDRQLGTGEGITLLAECLNVAECVLWEPDIWSTALAGHTAFVGEPCPDTFNLVSPQLWSVPGQLGTLDRDPRWPSLDNTVLKFILLIPQWYIQAYALSGWTEGSIGYVYGFVKLQGQGPVLPSDYFPAWLFNEKVTPGQPVTESYSAIIAASLFMKQPFVKLSNACLSRQMRRSYERKHGVAPSVKEVMMRKRQSCSSSIGNTIDWSCNWLVKGHWRKRSERYGEGGPIYVRPHIKGPEDKPFRAPRETVYRVGR